MTVPNSELPVTVRLENVEVALPVMMRAVVSIGPAKVLVLVLVTMRLVIEVEPRSEEPETERLVVEAFVRFV